MSAMPFFTTKKSATPNLENSLRNCSISSETMRTLACTFRVIKVFRNSLLKIDFHTKKCPNFEYFQVQNDSTFTYVHLKSKLQIHQKAVR